MKARKKPIEVFAVQYSNNIILEEFLKLLKTNEKEPVLSNCLKSICKQKENNNERTS